MMFVIKHILAITACLLVVNSALAQLPEAQPEHELLKKDVGTWKASMKMWMGEDGQTDPDAQPIESTGVETNRMLGEFWTISEFKSDFGGLPFEGHSTNGYDPKLKKYVGSWVDSMTPYAMDMVGTYDEKSKTLTSMSTGTGPDGEETRGKSVLVYKDKDHRLLTMYELLDGKELKMMQIEYERVKK